MIGPHSNIMGGVRHIVSLQLGVDTGPPRLPNIPLTGAQSEALLTALEHSGFTVRRT